MPRWRRRSPPRASAHRLLRCVFDPVSIVGIPQTSGFVDDPICAANGNMIHQDTDLTFPSVAGALNIVRTYNSVVADRDGVFGAGWSSALDAVLEAAPTASAIVVRIHDGAAITFVPGRRRRDAGAGDWRTDSRRAATVSTERRRRGVVHLDHERRLRFDPTGALAGWEAGVARVDVERTVDGSARLDERFSGRSVTVAWDGDLISSLTASDGRSVTYTRDGSGTARLGVARVAGDLHYAWDGNLLLSVVDNDGVAAVRQRVRRRRPGRPPDEPVRADHGLHVPGSRRHRDRRPARRPPGDGARRPWQPDRGHRRRRLGDADHLRRRRPRRPGRQQVGRRMALRLRRRHRRPADPPRPRRTQPVVDVGRVGSSADRHRPHRRHDDVRVRRRPSHARHGHRPRREHRDRRARRRRPARRDHRRRRCRASARVGHATASCHGSPTAIGADHLVRVRRRRSARPPHRRRPACRRRSTTSTAGLSRSERADAVSMYSHTPAGRINGGIEPGGVPWSATFGPHGAMATITDGLGSTATYEYDVLGDVTAVIAPDGAAYRNEFDEVGRLVSASDPAGGTLHKGYDVEGRLVEFIDPDGRVTRRGRRRARAHRPVGGARRRGHRLDVPSERRGGDRHRPRRTYLGDRHRPVRPCRRRHRSDRWSCDPLVQPGRSTDLPDEPGRSHGELRVRRRRPLHRGDGDRWRAPRTGTRRAGPDHVDRR